MCDTVTFAGKALKLNDENDAQPIVNAIVDCVDLRTLILEGNTLGINAAKAIGKSLESRPTLVNAQLKDLFTGRLKTEIPDAIRFLTGGISLSGAKLTLLDLSDNAFGPIGVKALLPFLKSESCSRLRELRLNNNGLGPEGGKLLSTALKDLRYLEVLICGRNRLENDAAIAFGNALSNLTTLRHLELPQNGIRYEGIDALSKAIKANENLEVLNLNDNTMTSKGGEAMAAALVNSLKLEVINFGDCLIRRGGCRALLNSLQQSGILENIRELTLSGNEIGGREVTDIIISLFTNPSLNLKELQLDLSCNNFGEELSCDLKQKLQHNVDLTLTEDEGSGDEETEEFDEEEESENDEAGDGGDEQETEEDGEESKDRQEIEDLSKIVENGADLDMICEKFVTFSVNDFDAQTETLPTNTLKKCEKLIEAAVKNYQSYLVANSLLVHMGLLKGESKKENKEVDLRGPFICLSNAIGHFDKTQKDVFQLFLGKPHRASDKTGKIKHKLLQALYV